jgi:hypothetical protein
VQAESVKARERPVAAAHDPALTTPSLEPAPQPVDNLIIHLVELLVRIISSIEGSAACA